MSPKARTVLMFLVIATAIAILILWQRRERTQTIDTPSSGSTSTAGSSDGSSSAPPAGSSAGSAERVRKIDKAGRDALLDRIRTARDARGTHGGPGATSAAPRPALPALPGSISKDDIRAGVRAVIPLLAECYSAAQDRLPIKEGQIVVQMHLTGEPDIGTLIEKAEIGGDAQFTKDAELVECLQQTMLSVELPPIEGGGSVDVTYPIAFAPG